MNVLIEYVTDRGIAEWVNFDPKSDCGAICLKIGKEMSGAVMLGEAVFPLNRGKATVQIDLLPDGEYKPRFETDAGVFVAEAFVKQGRNIILSESDELFIRRILKRCAKLEDEKRSLEKRVLRLEKLCQGHNIFNFERKEQ